MVMASSILFLPQERCTLLCYWLDGIVIILWESKFSPPVAYIILSAFYWVFLFCFVPREKKWGANKGNTFPVDNWHIIYKSRCHRTQQMWFPLRLCAGHYKCGSDTLRFTLVWIFWKWEFTSKDKIQIHHTYIAIFEIVKILTIIFLIKNYNCTMFSKSYKEYFLHYIIK